jgi:hypothetical protein
VRAPSLGRPPPPTIGSGLNPAPRCLHADPPNAFYNELNPEHETWRRTTALEISHRSDPPMRVKMLVRDFIDDSLYNVRTFVQIPLELRGLLPG